MNFISSVAGKTLLSIAAVGAVVSPFVVFAQENHDQSDNQSNQAGMSAKPGVDVMIGAAGRVVVHGATVTGVSSTTVTATTIWGGTTITWSVNDANAKITFKGGRVGDVPIITVGDSINFEGMLGTGAFSVNAKTVRDLSKEKHTLDKHVFNGTVSMAPASTTPTSFKYVVGSTTYIVNVPVGISILGKNWLSLPIGSFMVGDKVNVYGAVQAASTTTIDASVVRNTSR